MKKLLFVTLLALGATQAMASELGPVITQAPPQVCPSWGCGNVPFATLASEQVKLNTAISKKLAVQKKLGGGGCFKLANGQVECL